LNSPAAFTQLLTRQNHWRSEPARANLGHQVSYKRQDRIRVNNLIANTSLFLCKSPEIFDRALADALPLTACKADLIERHQAANKGQP